MTLSTESQNFSNLVNRNADPSIMTIDIAGNERKQAERRAVMEKANPSKPEPARVELNKLRSQLFNLQQQVKNLEIKVNNEAGNVQHLEGRLAEVLKTKKQQEASGNLLAARNYEHSAHLLENELSDTRERLVKEQRCNASAARELRTWQTEHGARLKELQKEVG
jgi:hypothetical protein